MRKQKKTNQAVSLALSVLLCLTAPGMPAGSVMASSDDSVIVQSDESEQESGTDTGSQIIVQNDTSSGQTGSSSSAGGSSSSSSAGTSGGSSASNTENTGTAAVSVVQSELIKKWGTKPFSMKDNLTVNSQYTGTLTYSVDQDGTDQDGKTIAGNQIVSIDSTGTATLKGTGKAGVTIHVPSDGTFQEQTLHLTLTVQPIDLGTLTADSFTWTPLQKTYDGTDTFQVSGSLKDTSLLIKKDDAVTASAVLTADGSSIGEHTTTMPHVTLTVPQGYTAKTDWTKGPDVIIAGKAGTLDVQNGSMTYGDSPLKLSSLVKAPDDWNGTLSYSIKEGTEIVSLSDDGTLTALKAGEAVIQVTADGADAYTTMTADISVTVKEKAITLTDDSVAWDTTSKVYDGKKDLAVTGTVTEKTCADLVSGDTLSVSATATADSASVGTHTTTLSDAKVEGADGKYTVTLSLTNGPEMTITSRSLEVKDGTLDLTYGDSDVSVLSAVTLPDDYTGKPSYTLTAGNDFVTLTEDGKLTAKKAGTADIQLDLPADETYRGGSIKITVTVKEKAITLTDDSIAWDTASKVYDGKTDLAVAGTVTEKTCADLVSGDTLSVSATATADSASVGAHTTTLSDAKVEGADGKYAVTLSLTNGPEMAITSRSLDVKDGTLDLTYGDSDVSVLSAITLPDDYTGTPTFKLAGETDVVSLTEKGMIAAEKAGMTDIEITLPADAVYAGGTASVSVTVKEKAITLKDASVAWETASKVYDGKSDLAVTGTVTEKTCADLVSGDTLSVSAAAKADSAAVGTHPTTLSDISVIGADGKYAVTLSLTNGPEMTITSRNLGVKDGALTLTYGDSDISVLSALTVPSDYIGSPSYSLNEGDDYITLAKDGSLTAKKAGHAEVQVSLPADATYAGSSVKVTVTVNEKAITLKDDSVTWNPAAKAYDGTAGLAVTGTVTEKACADLVSGDTLSISAAAKADSAAVGTHPTTLSDIRVKGADGKYAVTLSLTKGPEMTIAPRDLGVKDGALTLTYGERDVSVLSALSVPKEYTGTPVFKLTGKTEAVAMTEDGKLTAKSAGTAEIQIDLPSDATYSGSSVKVTVTVKKKVVTLKDDSVTWNQAAKVYDGTADLAVTGTVTEKTCADLASGDTLSVSAAAKADSAAVGTHKTTLSDIKVDGADGKYAVTLSLSNGPAMTIKARTLRVKDGTLALTYGDSGIRVLSALTLPDDYTGTPSYELSGTAGVLSLTEKGVLAAVRAGTAVIQVHFPADATYTEADAKVTAAVKEKAVTLTDASVAWNAASKTYDGETDLAVTGTVTEKTCADLMSGDMLLVTATAKADAAAVGKHKTTLSDLKVNGADGKYAITVSTKNGPEMTIKARVLKAETKPVSVTYGDEDVSLRNALTLPAEYTGTPSYSLRNGSQAIALKDGKITAVGTGSAVVDVTLPADATYTAGKAEIHISSAKKAITLDLSKIKWNKAEKTFDGSSQMSVSGAFDGSSGVGLVGKDTAAVAAVAQAESADIGTWASSLSHIVVTCPETYQYQIKGAKGPSLVITPKTLQLNALSVTAMYGSDAWTALCSGSLPKDMSADDVVQVVTTLNDTDRAALKKIRFADVLSVSSRKQTYHTGTASNALTIRVVKEAVGNYLLKMAKPAADIIITNEKLDAGSIWKLISLDPKESRHAADVNGTVFLAAGGKVAFRVTGTDRYDTVNLIETAPEKADHPSSAVSASAGVPSGEVKGRVYLSQGTSRSETDGGDADIPSGKIRIDADAPEIRIASDVRFASVRKNGKETEKGTYSMPVKTDGSYSVKLAASDPDSGLDSVLYHVYSVRSSEDLHTVEKAMPDGTAGWTSLPKDGMISIGPDEGDYVIALYARDRVGNTSCAVSNVIAIDRTAPAVSMTGLTENALYGKNMTYQLSISDPSGQKSGTQSGLQSLTVSVRKDGEEISGNAEDRSESYQLDLTKEVQAQEDPFKEADALAHKSSPMILTGTLNAARLNSNQVEITVTAKDRAGHTTSVTRHIRFDVTASVLTASLDGKARNGHYFNADRRMTVMVTERNFEENGLALLVNGKAVTLSSLRSAGKSGIDGVYLVEDRSDSQGSVEEAKRTDARTNRYVIGFGGNGTKADRDYTIRLSVKDAAGHQAAADFGASEAPETFTVDETAPEFAIVFKTATGRPVQASSDVAHPAYSQVPVIPVLTVKERNFGSSGLALTLTSKNSSGKTVEGYRAEVLSAPRTGTWTSEGNEHTYVMETFSRDAANVLAGSYTDLAGNTAVYVPHAFTVDQTAPSGKIILQAGRGKETEVEADAGSNVSVPYQFFDPSYFDMTVSGTDETSGIASIQYAIADGDEQSKKADAVLSGLHWQSVSGKIRVPADRMGLLLIRIEDRAGHVTYKTTRAGWIADQQKPASLTASVIGRTAEINRGDVELSVSADDAEVKGVYSGIRTLSYQVVNGTTGKTTQSGTMRTSGPREKTLSGKITLNAAKNNSNQVRLILTAEDYAGNKASKTFIYAIDVTKPTLTASWDKTKLVNGIYTNQTRSLMLQMQERNPKTSQTNLTVTIGNTQKTWSLDALRRGDASSFGITADGYSDNGSRKQTKDQTDSRLISLQIHFGTGAHADFDYRGIRFSSVDQAGNNGALNLFDGNLTVDKVAPVIRVSYRDNGDVTGRIGMSRSGCYATRGQVTPTVTIQERNFRASDVRASVGQTDVSGRNVSSYGNAGDVSRASAWNSSGTTRTCTMSAFTRDANFSLSIRYTDLAGNAAAVYPEHYFTVDHTAPTGTIRVQNVTYSGLRTAVRFAFVQSGSMAASRTASDAISGVASVSIYRYTPPVNASGTFSGLTASQLAGVSWTPWNGEAVVSPDRQTVLYARIQDRAGNVSYVNTDGILADRTSPSKPTITLGGKPSAKGIYASDVPVRIHAEDVLSGGTYAGLASVKIEVLNGSSVTQTEDRAVGSKGSRIRSWDGSITIAASKNNSNSVKIRVTAVDTAGNRVEAEQSLKIDTSKPEISVTYDQNKPANGHYYNAVRTATVTVRERNFDASGVTWSIKGAAGRKPVVGSWKIGGNGTSDNAVNQCTVTFSEDDDYTFTLSVTDEAGNKTELGRTDSFTIDRTAPVLHVAYDPEKGKGSYFNGPRTVTLTVTEHNFRASDVDTLFTAELDGKKVTVPPLGAWKSQGDRHTATVTFKKDGVYRLSFRASDMADNKTKKEETASFTIDTEKPSVIIRGVKSRESYRGSVSPSVTFRDINFDRKSVQVYLSGTYHQKDKADGTWTSSKEGGTFTMADFPHKASADDVYTLTAIETDKAGNVTKKTVRFSVNRFGSTYEMDDDTKTFLKTYAHQKGQDLVIREINVDPLTGQSVTMMRNGATQAIADEDWSVEDTSEAHGWKEYVYTIRADAFEKEGAYEIRLFSKDKAGNMQDTSAKDIPIRFAIDRTAPSAVITGIENDSVYNANGRTVTIVLSDNLALSSASVSINGKKKVQFTEKEIEKAGGQLTVYVGAANTWQTVRVQAEDTAGNLSKDTTCRVLISPSGFVRFVNSQAFIVLAGGILAGLALLIILVIVKRKKKKKADADKEASA